MKIAQALNFTKTHAQLAFGIGTNQIVSSGNQLFPENGGNPYFSPCNLDKNTRVVKDSKGNTYLARNDFNKTILIPCITGKQHGDTFNASNGTTINFKETIATNSYPSNVDPETSSEE